jgi:hypothetical protein
MVPPRTHKRNETYAIVNNKPVIFQYNSGLNSRNPEEEQKTSYSFYKATATSKDQEFFGDIDSIDEPLFSQP